MEDYYGSCSLEEKDDNEEEIRGSFSQNVDEHGAPQHPVFCRSEFSLFAISPNICSANHLHKLTG